MRERSEQLLWPLVIVLVLVAPSQYSYALDPKDGPFILYADLFAAAIVGLWAILVLAGRRRDRIVRPPAALWALIGVAVLSGLGATSLKSAAVEIAQLVLYFVAVYALLADVLRGQHRIVVAAKALAIATTVVVAVALYQYLTAADAADVRGTFGNRNVYGAYLAMVLPLLYGIAIWTRDTVHRSWFLVVVAAGAVTMLAGVQFWCMALVMLVLSALKSLRALSYYLLAVAVFIAIAVSVLPQNRIALFSEVADPIERGEVYHVPAGQEPPTLIKKRWLEWQPALSMLADNFALGVGTGNYQLHIGSYYGRIPNAKKTEPDTNNLYLVIGSSMGFPGLVAFVAWLGHFWRLAERNWQQAHDGWSMGICWGLLGSVYAIAVVNLFSSLFVRGNSVVWALIFAMVASVHVRGFEGRPALEEADDTPQQSRGEE